MSMIMTAAEVKKIENTGSEAVKRLRIEKLKSGHPFMINSKELMKGQSYLEYPDGTIQLVRLSGNGFNFIPIKTLTKTEKTKLRSKFGLSEYYA